MPTIEARGQRAMINGLTNDLNTGVGTTPSIQWTTSGDVQIAISQMSATSFQVAETIAGPPIVHRAVANTIAQSGPPSVSVDIGKMKFRDKASALVFTLTVGETGSGADVLVADNTVPGNAVAITVDSFILTGQFPAA